MTKLNDTILQFELKALISPFLKLFKTSIKVVTIFS